MTTQRLAQAERRAEEAEGREREVRAELARAYDTIDRMGDVLLTHGRERRVIEGDKD